MPCNNKKYYKWKPKNICNKTACPPPCPPPPLSCNSLDNSCPSGFYRVTIKGDNNSGIILIDPYSNVFYNFDDNENVLYFPLESKNLILFNHNNRECYNSDSLPIELLQYCSLNSSGWSFLLTMFEDGKSAFTPDINNIKPIPSKIYKVILDTDNSLIYGFALDIQWLGFIHKSCCTYGYVWLPKDSSYINPTPSSDVMCTVPPATLPSESCQFFIQDNDTCEPQNVDTNKKLNELKNKFPNFNFNKFTNFNKNDTDDK